MANTAPEGTSGNHLLKALTRRACRRVLAQAEAVEMQFGEVLCEPDFPYQHVYFPLSGFVSLVTTVDGHQPFEVGLIGNEGMLGATVALDIQASPLRGVVQGAGRAMRMPVMQFRQALSENATLSTAVKRYLYVLMAQLTQTAACTCFHEIGQRLARWLLMTHDRAQADSFHLTHQLLADMLGVRRSAVTIAAGTLQAAQLISYTRGEITVVNRKGLEDSACECYQAVIDDYARLFPPLHCLVYSPASDLSAEDEPTARQRDQA